MLLQSEEYGHPRGHLESVMQPVDLLTTRPQQSFHRRIGETRLESNGARLSVLKVTLLSAQANGEVGLSGSIAWSGDCDITLEEPGAKWPWGLDFRLVSIQNEHESVHRVGRMAGIGWSWRDALSFCIRPSRSSGKI